MGQQNCKLLCGCGGSGKKERRKRRRRLHYDEIYQPSDLSEWEKIKDKEILTAASREPVAQIEVQAHCTESKGNISTKMVEMTSKSVGLIIGYLTSGTGFRVGEKYIMTSLHIVKGICNFGGMFKESNLESPDVYICFNYTGAYDTDRLIFYFVGKIRYANEELDVAILELKSNNDKILPPSIPCCINFQCGIDPGFHLIGQSYKDPNKIIEKNIQLWTKNVEVIKKAQTWSMDMFKENGYLGLDDPKKELCSCNYQLSMDGAPGIVTLRQKQEPTDLSDCQIDLHIAKGDDNLQPIHEDECAVSVELSGNERLLRCRDSRFELNIYDETDSDNEITYVKMVNAKCDDMPVESSHTNYSGHESSLVCSDDSIKYSSHLVKVESHEKIDRCLTHENLLIKHCIDSSERNVEESLEMKINDCCSSIVIGDSQSVYLESLEEKINDCCSSIVIDDRKCINLENLEEHLEECRPCTETDDRKCINLESLEENLEEYCPCIETDDMECVKESRNDKLNMSENTREEIILQREITLITKTESSTREEITAVTKTESSVTDTRDVFLDKTYKNERRNNLKKTDEENTFSIQNEDKELISELECSSDMSCPAVGFECDNPLVQEHQGEVTCNLEGEVSSLIDVRTYMYTGDDHFISDDGYQSISWKCETLFPKDDSTSITNSEHIEMSENESLILTTKESDLEMSNSMDSTNTNIHLENKHNKQFNINYDHVEIGNDNVELEISTVLTEKDATHEIVFDTLTTGSDICYVNALIKPEDKTDISCVAYGSSVVGFVVNAASMQYLPQRVLGTKYTMLNIPQFIAATSQLSMHTPAPSTMQAVIVVD